MQDFYDEHAISTRIGQARPYARYERGDPERIVRKAWPQSPQFAARIANQGSGIVISRYGPSYMKLPHVPAELRPNSPVVTSSHWHYHGDVSEIDLIIPSSGKHLPRKHRHAPDDMERHIAKVHGGVNTNEVHLDENRAKYVFPTGRGARRLDEHPNAWPLFRDPRRVFFVIEGCIKADAVLSAGEAVFSVPSVTLWRAPELDEFAPRLRGVLVYIVPDSDWYGNDAVLTQAMFCRSYLRRLGVNTHIAAPPPAPDGGKRGIDDHLHHGGALSQLEVLEREAGYGLAEFIADNRKWRKDKVVRGAEVLESLALHAGSDTRHSPRIFGKSCGQLTSEDAESPYLSESAGITRDSKAGVTER
jgi:hypothetical protein